MALDHVRDFFQSSAMSFSPEDLSKTTPILFFTRWITHFCAPVFAFTAGIGVFLWLGRNRTKAQLSRFLLTRGLWLIFLELTVLRFILFFDFRFTNTLIILSVIWMLGLCMIVLAALVHLPTRLLAVLSIVAIAAHNFLDPVRPNEQARRAARRVAMRLHEIDLPDELVGLPCVVGIEKRHIVAVRRRNAGIARGCRAGVARMPDARQP